MTRLLPFLLAALAAGSTSAQVVVRVGADAGAAASGVAIELDGTLEAAGPLATADATVTFSDPSTGGIVLSSGLDVTLVEAGAYSGTSVAGSVQIAGPLTVAVVPGVRVEAGDLFNVLACTGACSGPFDGVQSPFDVDVTYGDGLVTVEALEGYTQPPVTVVRLVDGDRGVRYFGPPGAGMTVDDLAAQNLVRGVPGYYPDVAGVTLWTRYDPVAGEWVPSEGAGEALELGKAFRWYFLDRDGVGDPEVSVSRALPFTLAATVPANTEDVVVELLTVGNRFNDLANPFGVELHLSEADTWPGAPGIRSRLYTYDEETASWRIAPDVIGPWRSFRFRAKGPRRNGNPRLLVIPSSSARLGAAAARASERAPKTPASRPAVRVEAAPQLAFRLEGATPDGRPLADGMLTVAFADTARAAFSVEEDVEKFQPPARSYALLGARVDGQLLGLDARPFGRAEIPLALEARGATGDLTLSWDASTLPPGLPVALVDLQTGREVDVRAASSVTFRAPSRRALEAVPAHDLARGADAADRFVLRIGESLSEADAPAALALSAPAPNPSDGAARLTFALPEGGPVRLAVYDVRGREVAVLADGRLEAGWHEAALPGRGLAAGVYVVRLEADGRVLTQRATVVR